MTGFPQIMMLLWSAIAMLLCLGRMPTQEPTIAQGRLS